MNSRMFGLAILIVLAMLIVAPATAQTFDNSGGGSWKEYVSFPIAVTPTEHAQYKIIIDGDFWTIYNVKGELKATGTYTEFWNLVQNDGDDIRIFDQNYNQLYFWIENFDYTNKTAIIWVKIPAGTTELNIAYGNPSATESAYNDISQTFEFGNDFSQDPSTQWTLGTGWSWDSTNGFLHFESNEDTENNAESPYNISDGIVFYKLRYTGTGSGGNGYLLLSLRVTSNDAYIVGLGKEANFGEGFHIGARNDGSWRGWLKQIAYDYNLNQWYKVSVSITGTPARIKIGLNSPIGKLPVSISPETYAITGYIIDKKYLLGGGFWKTTGNVNSGGVFLYDIENHSVVKHWIPDYDGNPHANSNHVVLKSSDGTKIYVFGEHWQGTSKAPMIVQVFDISNPANVTRIGQEYHPDTADGDEPQCGFLDKDREVILIGERAQNPNRLGLGGGGIWVINETDVLDHTKWTRVDPPWGNDHSATSIVKFGNYYYIMVGLAVDMYNVEDDLHALWRVPVGQETNASAYEKVWEVKKGTANARELSMVVFNGKLYYPKLNTTSDTWELIEFDGTTERKVCDIMSDVNGDLALALGVIDSKRMVIFAYSRDVESARNGYIVYPSEGRITLVCDIPCEIRPWWHLTFEEIGKHIEVDHISGNNCELTFDPSPDPYTLYVDWTDSVNQDSLGTLAIHGRDCTGDIDYIFVAKLADPAEFGTPLVKLFQKKFGTKTVYVNVTYLDTAVTERYNPTAYYKLEDKPQINVTSMLSVSGVNATYGANISIELIDFVTLDKVVYNGTEVSVTYQGTVTNSTTGHVYNVYSFTTYENGTLEIYGHVGNKAYEATFKLDGKTVDVFNVTAVVGEPLEILLPHAGNVTIASAEYTGVTSVSVNTKDLGTGAKSLTITIEDPENFAVGYRYGTVNIDWGKVYFNVTDLQNKTLARTTYGFFNKNFSILSTDPTKLYAGDIEIDVYFHGVKLKSLEIHLNHTNNGLTLNVSVNATQFKDYRNITRIIASPNYFEAENLSTKYPFSVMKLINVSGTVVIDYVSSPPTSVKVEGATSYTYEKPVLKITASGNVTVTDLYRLSTPLKDRLGNPVNFYVLINGSRVDASKGVASKLLKPSWYEVEVPITVSGFELWKFNDSSNIALVEINTSDKTLPTAEYRVPTKIETKEVRIQKTKFPWLPFPFPFLSENKPAQEEIPIVRLEGTLRDFYNAPVPNRTIKIEVASPNFTRIYNVTTDSSGNFKIEVDMARGVEYKVSYKFAGDDVYVGTSTTKTFTIEQLLPAPPEEMTITELLIFVGIAVGLIAVVAGAIYLAKRTKAKTLARMESEFRFFRRLK